MSGRKAVSLEVLEAAVATKHKEVALLERIGHALYGDRRRWVLLESDIPRSFLDEKLPPLFKVRAENLAAVLAELVRGGEVTPGER